MSHDESPTDAPGEDRDEAAEGELAQVPNERGHELRSVAEATGDLGVTEPVGFIEKFQLSRLRSRKELEAVEIVLDARLDEMRRQADAAAQESKAYWDGRTAEVVSAMKTVVQARLRAVENERMANRFESIEAAYNLFAKKVREVESGPLPEELRENLIQKLRGNLTATIERLEADTLADGYDLKD